MSIKEKLISTQVIEVSTYPNYMSLTTYLKCFENYYLYLNDFLLCSLTRYGTWYEIIFWNTFGLRNVMCFGKMIFSTLTFTVHVEWQLRVYVKNEWFLIGPSMEGRNSLKFDESNFLYSKAICYKLRGEICNSTPWGLC